MGERMKRNRIIFGILWGISLAGISFFGGVVSYGFFTLLSLIFVISMLYLLCVHIFFRIYQELDNNAPAVGDAVPFQFLLKNEYFFGFAGIRVRFFQDFSEITGLSDDTEFELIPRTGIERRTELVCRYRGEYEVGIRAVELQDYFRLFTISFKNRETLRVTVRPRIIALEQLKKVDLSYFLKRDSTRGDDDPDILTRKYETGDDPRQIHWKASVRSGELLIRKRMGREQEGVCILMDTCRRDRSICHYLPVENKILEIVVALTLFFAKQGIRTEIFYDSGSSQAPIRESVVADVEHFGNFYEEISGVEFREKAEEGIFFRQVFRVPGVLQKKLVFLILQQWSDHADELTRELSKSEIYTIVYLVNDEQEEPPASADIKNGALIRVPAEADITEVL